VGHLKVTRTPDTTSGSATGSKENTVRKTLELYLGRHFTLVLEIDLTLWGLGIYLDYEGLGDFILGAVAGPFQVSVIRDDIVTY
jgi:hypothetical protein